MSVANRELRSGVGEQTGACNEDGCDWRGEMAFPFTPLQGPGWDYQCDCAGVAKAMGTETVTTAGCLRPCLPVLGWSLGNDACTSLLRDQPDRASE